MRRRPEESVLDGVVQSELASFLAGAHARERPVPRFVERELRFGNASKLRAVPLHFVMGRTTPTWSKYW